VGASWLGRNNPGYTREWKLPEADMAVSPDFDIHTIADPGMPQLIHSRTRKKRESGLYGVVRWSLADSFTLVTGARASWYDYKDRNAQGELTRADKQNGEITPYAAALWDVAAHYTVYASYSDIFRVQSDRYQANGQPLDPAIGANYEIGIKGSSEDERLNGSIALFRIVESNRAQTDPDWQTGCPASPNGGACYLNAGKVRSQGLDAELNGEVLRDWHWSAGYTYNTTKYLRDSAADGAPSDNQGQPLRTTVPKHIVRLYSKYLLPGTQGRWAVHGGVSVQSDIYSGSNVKARQGGFAVWNAGVGWQVNPKVGLQLSVNNLFDKTYWRKISTGAGNIYGEPRNVMLTARMRF